MDYRYKVFISYRREDAVFKDTVYNILNEYIDEDRIFVDTVELNKRPNKWFETIHDALLSSEYILICINKDTFFRESSENKTDYYYKEIEIALQRQTEDNSVHIIPIINIRPNFNGTRFRELSQFQDVSYRTQIDNTTFQERLLKILGIEDKQNGKKSSYPTVIKNIVLPHNLVPRFDMLNKVWKSFYDHNCVVVSGIGGSGKTSLAYMYAKEQNFNNIAWVTVNGKIEDAFLEKMAEMLFEGEEQEKFMQNPNKQAKLAIIKNKLSDIKGKNLLVLDVNTNNGNIKQEINTQIYKYLPSDNWKTLVLTRAIVKNKNRFAFIEMDKMTGEEAKELFLNNYDGGIKFSDDQLDIIVNELYYHPLLIEQTAIAFSNSQEQDADEVLNNIKGNKVKNKRTEEILGGLAIEEKEIQDIYTYLINLCKIENLSDDEIKLLACYVTWPNEPIDYEVIETLLFRKSIIAFPIVRALRAFFNGYDNEEMKLLFDNLNENKARQIIKMIYENTKNKENKQFFKEVYEKCNEDVSYATLNAIVEKGILSHNDSNQFSIHSLMADVIREQINIKKYDYTEYLDNIQKMLDDKEKFVTLHKFSKCIASSFINHRICSNVILFTNFLNVLCYINDAILYNLPEPEFTSIVKQLEENAEPFQATGLYNAVAKAEYLKNNLSDAKSHYEKAVRIMDGVEGNDHTLFLKAGLLHNLAMLAEKIGDTDSTKKYFEKSLEILRKLPETPQHLNDLATTINHLADLEEKLNDIDSAKKHYEESLVIKMKLPKTPQYLNELATTQNNLAMLENKLGNTDSAKKYYEESIKIKRNLPKTPLYLDSLATTLLNLALLEENIGDTNSAKTHFEETLEIGSMLPETPLYLHRSATTLYNFADLEESLGDTNSAKKHYEEGLKIARKINNEEYISFFESKLSYL